MEEWKDITGYKKHYQVSDCGRVRSLDRVIVHPRGFEMRLKGKFLKFQPQFVNDRIECLHVKLSSCGSVITKKVHRLVLEAFVGNCPEGYESCHNDGDASNNKVENLRWDTHEHNMMDKRHHGTSTERRVWRSDGIEFNSAQLAARITGCYASNILHVCNQSRKMAGNYCWKYI